MMTRVDQQSYLIRLLKTWMHYILDNIHLVYIMTVWNTLVIWTTFCSFQTSYDCMTITRDWNGKDIIYVEWGMTLVRDEVAWSKEWYILSALYLVLVEDNSNINSIVEDKVPRINWKPMSISRLPRSIHHYVLTTTGLDQYTSARLLKMQVEWIQWLLVVQELNDIIL